MSTSIEEQTYRNEVDLLEKFPNAQRLSKTKFIIQFDNYDVIWETYPQQSGHNKFKIYNDDFKAFVHEIITQLKKNKPFLVSFYIHILKFCLQSRHIASVIHL